MAPLIIRALFRLAILLIAMAVVRRSIRMVGVPTAPGGRAWLLSWLGLIAGGLAIAAVLRACVPIRL